MKISWFLFPLFTFIVGNSKDSHHLGQNHLVFGTRTHRVSDHRCSSRQLTHIKLHQTTECKHAAVNETIEIITGIKSMALLSAYDTNTVFMEKLYDDTRICGVSDTLQ